MDFIQQKIFSNIWNVPQTKVHITNVHLITSSTQKNVNVLMEKVYQRTRFVITGKMEIIKIHGIVIPTFPVLPLNLSNVLVLYSPLCIIHTRMHVNIVGNMSATK